MKRLFAYVSSVILCCTSCNSNIDYYNIPLYSENNRLQAVVEIPAGTNKKIEVNTETSAFEVDQKNGKDRVIDFLPYPGNYGFIPSTYSDPNTGGDGDALDVLIISESLPTGSVVEIEPLGMLKLIDEGEIDYKIIAVPAGASDGIISAKTFQEFESMYPEAKAIIELWFLNYNKDDRAEVNGWADEKEALSEIERNKK